MDFSTLDTKTPAEKGAFLHLKHPALGHLLYGDDREKIGVMVRGTESRSVQARLRQVQKDRLAGTDTERGLEFVSSLVIGFVGVERDGKPVEPTETNIRWFFELSDGFVEQVIAFARDRASFFADASTT